MTKALSRNHRDYDDDPRETARAAARRSGKSLGDWLDDAIREKAAGARDDRMPARDDDDDRLDAVARRLARSSRDRAPRRGRDDAARRDEDRSGDRYAERMLERHGSSRRRDDAQERGRPPDGQRDFDPEAIAESAAAAVERRVAERERHTAKAIENLAGLIEKNHRRNERDAIKEAVAAFDRRADETERKTARALSGIAELIENGARGRDEAQSEGLSALVDRLGRIESKIAQQPAASTSRPIRHALARLESRIERLSSDDRTADFEQALSGLDQRLADIAGRLDDDARRREQRAAAAPEPVRPAPKWEAARAELFATRPLADAIAEIAERRRLLDDDAAPSYPPPPRGAVHAAEARSEAPDFPVRRLEEMQNSIEAISQQSRRLDEIQDSIDGVSRQSHRFDALQTSIDSVSQQTRRLDELKSSLDIITRTLDESRVDAGERAEQQLVVMRQIEALRRELAELTRTLGDLAPRASVSAIETALRDLAHRIDAQRDRGVADAMVAPAERIAGELRAAIKDLDPSPIVRNLHADVLTIGRRLDELQSPGADAEALRDLAGQTREVKELLTALVARPLPLERLETRVLDLTQRVDSLALASAKGAAVKDIGEVAKAIRSIVAAETSAGFQAFNQRLERLSAKFDEALAKSGAKRFDEINDRIDELGKSLAQRIDRAGAAQRPVDTAPLENLVAKLAKKIDSALEHKTASPAFDDLGRKIEKLEARLHDPAAAATVARIEAMLAKPGHEKHFVELTQRVDLVHKTLLSRLEQAGQAQDGANMRHVEQLARELGAKIDAAARPGADRRDFESLEQQIEQLSRKLDRLGDGATSAKLDELLARPAQNKQFHEIVERIDFLHNSLATRLDEGARAHAEASRVEVAELVEQLTRKINSALDPKADAGALQSLERQIQDLSRRLDRTDENGAALASIERKIADLFDRIEETRSVTTEAAEIAVRRATQDILREAAGAEPGALNQLVERELSDIRKTQDESGLRTHETLIAVHETLERVVDRLAVFEDELSEIRSAPAPVPPPPAATRPAAPAPRPEADVAPPPRPEPALAAPVTAERPVSRPVEDKAGFDFDALLIEPGARSAARRAPALDADLPSRPARGETQVEHSLQSEFIAAARRAAQQAAADAEAAEAQKARRGAARKAFEVTDAPEPASDGLGRLGAVLQARKRPLLLGLGALVLLIGAYQVARVGIEGRAPVESASQTDAGDVAPSHGGATHDPETAATPPQDAAPAPAAPKESAPKEAVPKLTTPEAGARGAAPSVVRPPMIGVPPASGPARNMAPKPGRSASAVDEVDPVPVGSIERPGAGPSIGDLVAAVQSMAKQGDPAAQYELGARYVEGRGFQRDAKTAAQWFEKAAEQGLAPAQYRLASLYEKGVGVDRDYARARKWYQSAAASGNARSMHNLAVLLAEGGDGKPDYTAAAEWFRKAAELGVRDSQYNLAILYARGLGVGQSFTQSYQWFAAAAQQGDADSAKKRDEIGARLDSKELAVARALVEAFKPKQPSKEANEVEIPRAGADAVKAPAAKPDAKPAAKPKISRL